MTPPPALADQLERESRVRERRKLLEKIVPLSQSYPNDAPTDFILSPLPSRLFSKPDAHDAHHSRSHALIEASSQREAHKVRDYELW
jgi:hypothetical protein